MPRTDLCHLALFLSQVLTLCQRTEPPSLTSLRIKASALMILIQLSHARRGGGGGGVVLVTTNCTGACMLLQ